MLNQVVIVGKLVEDPRVRVTKSNKMVSNITLEVSDNHKSLETGEYETNYIHCTLWSGIAETTSMYCKKGSVIGIKGRVIISYKDCNRSNKKIKYPGVIAEKVTFIKTTNEFDEFLL